MFWHILKTRLDYITDSDPKKLKGKIFDLEFMVSEDTVRSS